MINPANYLILSTGEISFRNVMLAAHEKARREMAEYRKSRLYTADDAVYWTYARHFKEALAWAMARAHQCKRMASRNLQVAA